MTPHLLHFGRFAAKRIWARYVFGAWFVIGAWGTLSPQLLPPSLESEWPNLYTVLAAISEFMPVWAWVIVGLVLLLAISIEYAIVQRQQAAPSGDAEIVQIRSDVKRLTRTLTGYGSPEQERELILELRERIENSDHAVWLDNDDLYQARVDFLHWSGVALVVREQYGVTYRNRQEQQETEACLKDAADRLEAGLTGKNIPAREFPPPMEP